MRAPCPSSRLSTSLLVLMVTLAWGCGEGDGNGPADGGADAVGPPVEGTGEVVVTWPGGQEVRVSALRMEAAVPCVTLAPSSPAGEICDAVITAYEGSELRLAISIPRADLAGEQTISLNDASLVRVEVRRPDGETATSTNAPPTAGAIVFGPVQLRPTLSVQASFAPDSHITGRTPSGGLIDVIINGSLVLP